MCGDLDMSRCGERMRASLSNGEHLYITSVKNTFVHLVPQQPRPTRSRSCFGRLETPKQETPELIDEQPSYENQPSTADAIVRSIFSEDREKWNSSTSCDLPSASTISTRGSTTASEESVHESFVAEQFRKYFVNTDNSGQTLMWHGLPTKYQVEPHLLHILDALKVSEVCFLYLPLNHWEKKGNPRSKCRNKGYAFVHFRTEEAASDFARKVAGSISDDHTHELTATTTAARQGISANLRALVSAPAKRTGAGALYLQNVAGALESVSLQAFRDLSSTSAHRARW
jgi:hypothetical protein